MSTNPKLRFGLWYDFRNPPAWRRPYDQLYSEIFEQITWGEQNGFDDIWLSEHQTRKKPGTKPQTISSIK